MDKLKIARGGVRGQVTKKIASIKALLQEEKVDQEEARAQMRTLETTVQSLHKWDCQVLELLLEEGCGEDDYAAELEAIERYQDEWNRMLEKFETIKPKVPTPPPSEHDETTFNISSSQKKRSFKLPKIELKKFGGQL